MNHLLAPSLLAIVGLFDGGSARSPTFQKLLRVAVFVSTAALTGGDRVFHDAMICQIDFPSCLPRAQAKIYIFETVPITLIEPTHVIEPFLIDQTARRRDRRHQSVGGP